MLKHTLSYGVIYGFLAFSVAPHAFAQSITELEQVQQQLANQNQKQQQLTRQQEQAAKELEKLRSSATQTARRVQTLEQALVENTTRLENLENEKQELQATLQEASDNLQGTLRAVQRLARLPKQPMLLRPQAPIENARTAALLQSLIQNFEAEIQTVKHTLARHMLVIAEINTTKKQQEADLQALATQQIALQSSLQRRETVVRTLQGDVQKLSAEVNRLSEQAENLQAFMQALQARATELPLPGARPLREEMAEAQRRAEQQRRAAEQARRAASAQRQPQQKQAQQQQKAPPAAVSSNHFPVAGTLLARFGQNHPQGFSKEGVTLQARSGGVVVAPTKGKVVYAGVFRGYGNIVIIQHQNGRHSLLSGLGHIDTTAGQWLDAREPIGRMSSDTTSPRLYIEVRHNGKPVDPLPWLEQAATKG